MKKTIRVESGVPTAIDVVQDQVPQVRVVRSGAGAEFHAPSGLWVATLRPRDDGAELTYRSGPTTPTLRNAVSLAAAVRDALTQAGDGPD